MRSWLAQSSEQLLKTLKILKTPGANTAAATFEDNEGFEEPHRDFISDPVEVEERRIVQYGAGVPREWAEGFARLDRASPPKGFSPSRWQRVIDDGGRFRHRGRARDAALGWDAAAVFGVATLRRLAGGWIMLASW